MRNILIAVIIGAAVSIVMIESAVAETQSFASVDRLLKLHGQPARWLHNSTAKYVTILLRMPRGH